MCYTWAVSSKREGIVILPDSPFEVKPSNRILRVKVHSLPLADPAGASVLIKTFTISNFRTFEHLEISDLERVNLIAGMNNVGKTALLEALWQFAGPDNPELGLRLATFRGLDAVDQSKLLYDLFHRYNRLNPIELMATGDWGPHKRSLRIEVRSRETSRVALPAARDDGNPSSPIAESPQEIVLHYTEDADTYESSGWIENRVVGPGLIDASFASKKHQMPERPTSHLIVANRAKLGPNEADRLSQLEVLGEEHVVVEALRSIEPDLRRLTIVTINGTPVIHADTGLGRLIPMALMGEGLQRVLSLMLAFEGSTGGLMLIDEIENGIHYSTLLDLWHIVDAFSRRYDTQVFATTHSAECVQAAHQAYSELEDYSFRFYRLDRIGSETKVKTFDKILLDTAFDSSFEIR